MNRIALRAISETLKGVTPDFNLLHDEVMDWLKGKTPTRRDYLSYLAYYISKIYDDHVSSVAGNSSILSDEERDTNFNILIESKLLDEGEMAYEYIRGICPICYNWLILDTKSKDNKWICSTSLINNCSYFNMRY